MAYTRVYRHGFEHGILACTILLLGLGCVMVYSSTVYAGLLEGSSAGTQQLRGHIAHVLIGIATMVTMILIPITTVQKWTRVTFVAVGIVIMLAVVFFGVERGNARRWFEFFGQTVQPGEFAKIAFVAWLAYSLARKGEVMYSLTEGILPHVLAGTVLFALFLLQTDLGSCIVLGFVLLGLLVAAGANLPSIAAIGACSVGLASVVMGLSVERRGRILAWLNPSAYIQDDGFQLYNSLAAVGSGGLTGSGLGSGFQNLSGNIPEADTDFVFAVIGEELGFIGAVIVLLVFAYIIYRGFALAARVVDDYRRYIVLGVTLLIAIHVVIHVFVTIGLFPTKGLTLPLVSRGGSSIIAMCAGLGLLLNVSREEAGQVSVTVHTEGDRERSGGAL